MRKESSPSYLAFCCCYYAQGHYRFQVLTHLFILDSDEKGYTLVVGWMCFPVDESAIAAVFC
jgi:hypothetical protein